MLEARLGVGFVRFSDTGPDAGPARVAQQGTADGLAV